MLVMRNRYHFSYFSRCQHICSSNRSITLGILRETHNKWERRAPLCPNRIQELLRLPQDTAHSHSITQVIVQPSTTRIFSDHEYWKAGAILQEDLSEAHVILGVKSCTQHQIATLKGKTLLLFAHVIKGTNMSFLSDLLHNNIRFIDYECITTTTTSAPSSNADQQKRIVAFGRYAGVAGMIDILQGLGQQLLLSGINGTTYSTPFLSCPLSYMHRRLEDAFTSVSAIGQDISSSQKVPPLVFAFTGKGNVIQGAIQVFEKLPVQWIKSKEELKNLLVSTQPNTSHYKGHVYGYMVKPEDIFVPKEEFQQQQFHNDDYRTNPFKYRSIFSQDIAPYINVLVNGAYWDERYPRILTKENVRYLYEQGHNNLIAIADISCDISGSIEFLVKATSVEHPFFHYNPISGEISDHIETCNDSASNGTNKETITVMGVDILPAELARESSQHFGNSLFPLLTRIIQESNDNNNMRSNHSLILPIELERACITEAGTLKPRYDYLNTFLKKELTKKDDDDAAVTHPLSNNGLYPYSILISLEGHLFDSGLINRALDIIESQNGCKYDIRKCLVGQKEKKKSSVLIRLDSYEKEVLTKIIPEKIKALANLIVASEASVKTYYCDNDEDERHLQKTDSAGPTSSSSHRATVISYKDEEVKTEQNVLILGAGRVSASVAEYIGRPSRRKVVVASAVEHDVAAVARHAVRGKGVVLDVMKNKTGFSRLVHDSDIVISLLPANMHNVVLDECIRANKNLVTASYAPTNAIDELNLHRQCQNAGIIMLNEMGLDPGIDHMMVLRIIDSIQTRGGKIKSFISICGGLPATVSSDNNNDSNLLRYKFSWSPLGVIKACSNPATYRQNKHPVSISGSNLLSAAFPVDIWHDLSYNLECIPNRDSLKYGDLYGISEDAETIFRGTLRYKGFSEIMHSLKMFGLFDDQNVKSDIRTWGKQLDYMVSKYGRSSLLECLTVLSCCPEKGARVASFLKWLGLVSSEEPLSCPESLLASFCQVLEQRLCYDRDEYDMVLMHHDIRAVYEDGSMEILHSNLKLTGDTNMSAMCKTVGYTAAIGADMILNNKITQTGLITPLNFSAWQCNEVLRLLQEEDIKFEETLLLENTLMFPLPKL